MQALRQRIEQLLDDALCNPQAPERLRQAMRYSTLNGGKRFRALLVYGAGLVVGAPMQKLDRVAASVECIHAYSLIHDDLPAMDDDDLRRGRATNHVEFDEATAILAGDALLTLAFELIADSTLNDKQARTITLQLTQSAGQSGMVGGQMLDIEATQRTLSLAQLEDVHRRKTGALIRASVICGALCGDDQNSEQFALLNTYANKLGLAFQVVDDILDIEGSTAELGKPKGSDQESGKATYPALIGLQESKKLATTLYQEAIESVVQISDNMQSPQTKTSMATRATTSIENCFLLKDLAEIVVKRTN